ncbi:MAG: M23 family metallopeptidase [Chlorobiaceae bacterium]|nr:M23 family metallopeptidase [Chlorobiaceae bacterium]
MVIHPFSKAVTVIGTAYAAEPAQAPASPAGSSTGELLTATELMIEKLVLQINQQDETSSDRKATRENSGKTFIAKLPDMRPVTGFITSSFGMREHPMYKRILFHAGTDFSAPIGTKVMATAEGTVAFSGFDRGYGKTVIINHAHGYQTVYAHLSKTLIRQGQRVNRGEVIAFSGNTGVSTGPHLHYEVHKDNVQVNPTGYFPADMSQDNRVTLQESTLAEEHSHS